MTEYSIAEANSHLAKIVREAEAGVPVRLMRHGKPVAVLLSVAEYERLTQRKEGFWPAYLRWRSQADWSEVTAEQIEDVFSDVRDKSPGRDFRLEE